VILCIEGVLPPAQLDELMRALPQARFEDGAATAGWTAREVKRNLQLGARSALRLRVQQLVEQALQAHEVFVAAALPRTVSQMLVSRTTGGGGYGNHVDNAVMGQPPLRTDLAFTLFLSHPADYEGGELVIDEPQGEQSFKLPAGHLVLYPATTLHRVNPGGGRGASRGGGLGAEPGAGPAAARDAVRARSGAAGDLPAGPGLARLRAAQQELRQPTAPARRGLSDRGEPGHVAIVLYKPKRHC
jgi:PKHD-type hydroxylase